MNITSEVFSACCGNRKRVTHLTLHVYANEYIRTIGYINWVRGPDTFQPMPSTS